MLPHEDRHIESISGKNFRTPPVGGWMNGTCYSIVEDREKQILELIHTQSRNEMTQFKK